ncbi:MAG TPA: hypothetical protein VLI04_21495 [Nocardioidaceae bacterium]|nr:hypothetical protein [Nocardioidaceae bacterium]
MSDLDRLHEIADVVRPPAFEELLETRRRRNRHTRLATASTLAVAAIAAVGVLAVTGANVRTGQPPVVPPPSPTPTEGIEIPAGQQTIMPDIGPGDIHGFDVLATVTNSQPEHQGDSELSATVTAHVDASYVVYYCRSHDVPTWIAYADGDLVSDSPGAAHDWWTFRACRPDDSTSLASHAELGYGGGMPQLEQKTAQMVAIAPPSQELRDCLAGNGSGDYCPLPEPIAATDAEFGFRIYEYTERPVLQLFEDAETAEFYRFEAVSSIKGAAWLVDRAVVAAPDTDRLAFELPASNAEYLVDVYEVSSPHFDRCVDQHQDELPDYATTDSHVYGDAVDKACGVDLRLMIDGNTIAPGEVYPEKTGHFSDLGARLSPGTPHRVEVTVVRGDPRNIRYAVIVRTRTQMP